MLTVFINWLYIFFITSLLGYGGYLLFKKVTKINISITLMGCLVTGIVLSTVYAEFFSIFHKIGFLANVILLVICISIFAFQHKVIIQNSIAFIKKLFSKKNICSSTLLYLFMIALFAFYTSRGAIHTDTSLYHAQAIRWYEEYGVVKGLGNLQWHFAYNTSYLAFAALFSMRFIFGTSLHCTTGYLAVMFCIWAIAQLKDFFKRNSHIGDFICIGILVYALVNITGSVSPASDYATMFMALYLMARWAKEIESSTPDTDVFSLLSVLAVYVCTLKLSAGMLVLLAIYPAVLLIKDKKVKSILLYLGMGIITLAPFIIRNIIISGWIVYPFAAIDLFNVDWKVPVQYVTIDSNQIKVWARCLYDAKLIDLPISEWGPIWWGNQERYAQMLILANILSICLSFISLCHKLIKKEKLNINVLLLFTTTILCLISWFLLAPFIRYGLAFLIAIPGMALGIWLSNKKTGFYGLVSGGIVFLMFFTVIPYLDHYFNDDLVFISQYARDPYYIVQRDYETSDMDTYDMNGVTIYCPKDGQITGYQYFPASSYDYMIKCTALRGDDIKNGFKNIEYINTAAD